VREDVLLRIGNGVELLALGAGGFDERRRVALGRVRGEAREDLEELHHARARARGGEADRNEVAFAKRLLERRVQLLRRELRALLEIERHQLFVDFHHLVDEGGMRRLHRGEIGIPVGIEEAVDHVLAAVRGEVDRQAFLAEDVLDASEEAGKVDVVGVDLVDEDHAVEPALGRGAHHARGVELDAVLRVDDDDGEVDAGERCDRLPGEIRHAGRVDEVDVDSLVGEVDEGSVEGVAVGLL
jgi:hypothetical protein